MNPRQSNPIRGALNDELIPAVYGLHPQPVKTTIFYKATPESALASPHVPACTNLVSHSLLKLFLSSSPFTSFLQTSHFRLYPDSVTATFRCSREAHSVQPDETSRVYRPFPILFVAVLSLFFAMPRFREFSSIHPPPGASIASPQLRPSGLDLRNGRFG